MTRVMLDSTMIGRLGGLNEPLEICDEQGRILGRFVPTETQRSLYDGIEPEVDEQELERREHETETCTTAEVLAHLEKL